MTDLAELHSKQVEFWNNEGAARWIANQARRLEQSRSSFADAALDAADIRPGESVIEIGCGTGENAVELATRVGATGKVLAVDVSGPILAEATQKLAGFANATAMVADAASFAFEPASTDLIFSRFGVMFFGDPAAAFANMRKALKPTGRIAFVCWRTARENAWMNGPLGPVFEHIARPPPPGPDEPGPFSFGNRDRLTGVLAKAGFVDVALEPLDAMRDVANGKGVDGALETELEFGPVPRLLAEQSAEVKAAVAQSLRAYFEPLEKDGEVRQPAAVWVVKAKAG